MQKTGKNIAILCCSVILIAAVTYSLRFINGMDALWIRIAALVGLNLMNGMIAFAAMRLTKMKVDIDLKNRSQYAAGFAIALVLSLFIAVIPALCGFSLVGEHTEFSWFKIIYYFLFCLLVIGPVEEFVFRVYLQEAFMSFFRKNKWMGVVIASLLFGLWHLINGGFIHVFFTFGIGLCFGFAKYRIKNCGYPGVAFGHGLYDFLNEIVRMFIV